MKKLVVKTIVITLVSLLGALILAFGSFALFAPGLTGKLFDGVGCYSASVFFYEKDYKRSGDISDLNRLVLQLDEKSDAERAEKYYAEIIAHKDFEALCQTQKGSGNISAKEYYYGNYALVLATNSKFSTALEVAKNFIGNNYSANNPLRVLIYTFISAEKTQEIALINQVLSTLSVENGANYIAMDTNYLLGLING